MDLGKAHGRILYATALAAYVSGKTFSVDGTNACTLWNGYEDAHNIVLP